MSDKIIKNKLKFIADIINGEKISDPNLEAFRESIKNDYTNFVNSTTLANSIDSFINFNILDHKLEEIIFLKEIADKRVINISGNSIESKYNFIYNFTKDKNINFINTIDNFIFNGDSIEVKALNYDNAISYFNYQDLCIDDDFKLKELLPTLSIRTQFKKYKNICFLLSDDSSRYSLNNFIFILKLDINDNITKDGLDLLLKQKINGGKFLILIDIENAYTYDELKKLLRRLEKIFNYYKIQYSSINFFSCREHKELLASGENLNTFLSEAKGSIIYKSELYFYLNKAFYLYEKILNRRKKYLQNKQKFFKSISLDAMEIDLDLSSDVSAIIQKFKIEKKLQRVNKDIEAFQKVKNKVYNNFNTIIKDIFKTNDNDYRDNYNKGFLS